jgi:hypothetical protein
VGLPANVHDFSKPGEKLGGVYRRTREFFLTAPRTPVARRVPRDTPLEPGLAPYATIGWLLDGAASGRVPAPGTLDDKTVAFATFRLAVHQSDTVVAKPCRPLESPVLRRFSGPEKIGFDGGAVDVSYLPERGPPPPTVTYMAANGTTIDVVAGPVTLLIDRHNPARAVRLCG